MDKYWTKHSKSTESTVTKGVCTNRLRVTHVMDTSHKGKEDKHATKNKSKPRKKQKSEKQKQWAMQYEWNKKIKKARKRMIYDMIKGEMNHIAYITDDTIALEADVANTLLTDGTTESDDNFGILSIYVESGIHVEYVKDSIGQSSDDDFGYVYFSISDFLK